MSIDAFTVRGGAAPWVDTVIEWTGLSALWTLEDITASPVILYQGTELRFDLSSTPETIYRLRLTDDSAHVVTLAYVTPPISAPVELNAHDITDTSAILSWVKVEAATQYEIEFDGVSQTIDAPQDPLTAPSLPLDALIPDRTYSARVRAYMTTTNSLWSVLIYFTTDKTYAAEATTYEYEPSQALVYTPYGWLPDGSPLYHGGGEQWGNMWGTNTTVFMYSDLTLASLRSLEGVRVLSAQVSITRFAAASDPRMVLNHWLLHDMAVPTTPPEWIGDGMGIDSGSVALGQQAWMSIPTGWVDAMIASSACGFGWGGVTGRYMVAQHISDPIRPRNGTLRITVG